MIEGKIPAQTSLRETLRAAFIDRETRPTYEDMSKEFNVPLNTVKNWAASENWQKMRLSAQEKLAEKSDALAIMLRAVKIDQRVVEAFANVVLLGFEQMSRVLLDIKPENAASSRAQTINTVMFAAKNAADGCKTMGLVGLPKELAGAGKEDNGRWNPGLLSQINLTINGMAAKVDAEQKAAGQKSTPAQAQPVEADETPLG